jgi:hypothetical protein
MHPPSLFHTHIPTSSSLPSYITNFPWSVRSAKPLRKQKRSHASQKRTPRRPNGHCPRTCSSLRTGARGSRQRTLMLVSVSPHIRPCESPASADGGVYVGEVGKLLGAKWKELDDEEKKVRSPIVFHPHLSRQDGACSPTLTKPQRTRHERRKKSRLMR